VEPLEINPAKKMIPKLSLGEPSTNVTPRTSLVIDMGSSRKSSTRDPTTDGLESMREYGDDPIVDGKKILNWKQYLNDEKLALDALKFEKKRDVICVDDMYGFDGLDNF
jgi:hypothetical protein